MAHLVRRQHSTGLHLVTNALIEIEMTVKIPMTLQQHSKGLHLVTQALIEIETHDAPHGKGTMPS